MKRKPLLLLVVAAAVACAPRGDPASPRAFRVPLNAHRVTGSPALPPGHPPIDGERSDSADSLIVRGKVAEAFDSAGYTYVRVATSEGDVWAAVPQTPLKVGATVTINGQLRMQDFESKTLRRVFDEIIFGTVDGSNAPWPHNPDRPSNFVTA